MKKTLWVASCVHLGADEHQADEFGRYLKYAKRHKWDVVFIGDLLNMGLCFGTKHVGSVWQDSLEPQEQLDKAIELLTPLKRQILGMSSGNHERRATNVTGLKPIGIIAKKLGVPFFRSSHVINWHGKRIFLAHGASGGVMSDFDKALRTYDNLDAVVLGHTHNLHHMMVRKWNSSGRKKTVHLVRTGCFLDDPEYAREALYPPTAIGSGLIELSGDDLNVRLGLVGL